MFKYVLLTTLLTIFISQTFYSQQYEDVVYTKSGLKIRGIIIEQIPNVSLKIQTKDGDIFGFTMDNILKMTKEPIESMDLNSTENFEEKSPTLAFFLSFLLPGLGQYYNGDVTIGIIQQTLYITGLVLFFELGWESVTDYYAYWDSYWEMYEYEYYYYDEETEWFYIGLGLAAGSAIWSWIDAPISANNYNNRLKQKRKFGHLIEFNDLDNTLGFDFGIMRRGLGINMTYHF